MKKLLPSILFIVLTLGTFLWLMYPGLTHQNAETKSSNLAKESKELNSLEKKMLGKWYLAKENIEGIRDQTYDRQEGNYVNYKKSGVRKLYAKKKKKRTHRWEVGLDSVLMLVSHRMDTSKMKILAIKSGEMEMKVISKGKNRVAMPRQITTVWKRY